ncbi:uncharacterized protein LOC141716414 [Apium graveolens]|uniref:uncharacterized protein LOC141716414 n=1 Tax=Apium graveolens TaxID=4045 RepID=UPI003D7A47B3
MEIFGFLKEKVQHKLQGWANRDISTQGKLTLLSSATQCSNNLVSTMIKAKYYPHTSFLDAEMGHSPSYVWRSLMEAMEVVKAGTRRKIGNGVDTKVWHVPWLPDVSDGCLTTQMPDHLKDITVRNLMDSTGKSWDIDLIDDIFNAAYQLQEPYPVNKLFNVHNVHEWREAQNHDVGRGSQHVEGGHVWTKPMDGWVKVNTDAALFEDGTVGVGCIIRDSQGIFLGGRCCRIVEAWSPKEAEAIVMKEALSGVISQKKQRCIMETDSRVLVQACNGQPGEAIFSTLVEDCLHLLKHINPVLVKFTYRSANSVTHALARVTYSRSEAREWHVSPQIFSYMYLKTIYSE